MVLYFVGLGLGNEDDITLRGLHIVQHAEVVILEAYTSVLLGVDPAALEVRYGIRGSSITLADRDMVEQRAEALLLEPAKTQRVAFLVVGDPVCATTHTDLVLRARQAGISVEIIHNASIMGVAGACGLQLYRFGQTVSIPYFEEHWRPYSFYSKIQYNRQGGLHTLCLLDIQVKEPDLQALQRGRTVYLPPRFMTIATAIAQLLEAESMIQEGAYSRSTLGVGLARMGSSSGPSNTTITDSSDSSGGDPHNTQLIRAGTLEELGQYDFGGPLHSLIICADELHEMEMEMLMEYMIEMEGSQYLSSSSSAGGGIGKTGRDPRQIRR